MPNSTDRAGPLDRVVEVLTAVALASMVLLVCGLVALRELRLDWVLPRVTEIQDRVLDRYTYVSQLLPVMLCWLTFLGAMLADRRGEHLGNDVLIDRLGDRPRRAVRLSGRFLWVAFFAVLTVLGIGQVAKGESLGELHSIGLPAWALQIGLPLGAGLVAVTAGRSLFADLHRPGSTAGPPSTTSDRPDEGGAA